jgi:hypothetical protein
MHKKKWEEYVLEFLMLFLAVFLGFFAENVREHQLEKERAKQYLRSFYEDLKTDTARISFYTNFDNVKLVSLQNLKTCYDTVTKNPAATACMLDLIKNSSINRPFMMTERTLNQLYNAGGFRLLKKEDADSIVAYQKEYLNFIDFQSTVFQKTQDDVRTLFDEVINFNANVQMFSPKGGRLISSFDDQDISEPILFSKDPSALNRYFNKLQLYYRVTYNHKVILLNLKEFQIRLLKYFDNKYRFD